MILYFIIEDLKILFTEKLSQTQNCVLPEYARYYLMSGTFIAYANHCSYGVKMPRLGTTDGKKAIFSLPPLSEQKRIVETIDFCFMQLNKISEALA